MATKEDIISVIAEQFGRTVDEVSLDDVLAKDYAAKSPDLVKLSATVSAKCGIKVPYLKARQAKTVADWVAFGE